MAISRIYTNASTSTPAFVIGAAAKNTHENRKANSTPQLIFIYTDLWFWIAISNCCNCVLVESEDKSFRVNCFPWSNIWREKKEPMQTQNSKMIPHKHCPPPSPNTMNKSKGIFFFLVRCNKFSFYNFINSKNQLWDWN